MAPMQEAGTKGSTVVVGEPQDDYEWWWPASCSMGIIVTWMDWMGILAYPTIGIMLRVYSSYGRCHQEMSSPQWT